MFQIGSPGNAMTYLFIYHLYLLFHGFVYFMQNPLPKAVTLDSESDYEVSHIVLLRKACHAVHVHVVSMISIRRSFINEFSLDL